ncbi:MAG: hypothetical protein V4736_00155 [Bdellovibrionota bacterium]
MTIGITELPPVATNFYTMCKKCAAERYHKVLTHTSEKSAKIECEVCHSKKTFTLPKAAKEKVAKVTKSGKPASPRGAAARATAALAKHEDQYQSTLAALESQPALDYKMSLSFKANQKVSHPKFGVGVVLTTFPNKVDILFKDEVRSLVHNRQ